MPLTEAHETWLEGREADRIKKMEEYARKITEAQTAKAEKRSKKEEKGSGDKEEKSSSDKNKKKKDAAKKKAAAAATATATAASSHGPTRGSTRPKYHTAEEFMAIHFPKFDVEDIDGDMEADGPMRTAQLMECERVMDAFADFDIKVKEKTIRNALMIPQDNPEAICLENLRTNYAEGLMENPLPRELWRKAEIVEKTSARKRRTKKKKS
jgi:hypothetical protein